MSSINIKPYESNLGGNFSRIDVSTVGNKNPSRSSSNAQFNKVSGTLSIQKSSTEQVSISPESQKISERERVEGRASNQLLSASLALTVRSNLNQELIAGVNKLKSIASNIEKEVNPINKQKLIDEANSVSTSLTEQFNKAVQEDPTLQQNYNATVLLSPGSKIDNSQKFNEISITSLSSPNDSGLTGIDFSNSTEAIEKIDLSLSNLDAKQTQFNSVATKISQSTSSAISSLRADKKSLQEGEKNEADENVIVEVTKNFLESNSITQSENKNIVEILDKTIDESKDENEDDDSRSIENKKSKEVASNNNKQSSLINVSA